jgi:hypothetical protein
VAENMGTVTITGLLDPPLADGILLKYIDPAGNSLLKTSQTRPVGSYLDEFNPTMTGQWQVQAFWGGDDTHAETESTLCSFEWQEPTSVITITPTLVISPTPTFTPTLVLLSFTPNINTYCREGPDYSFIANEVAMKGQAYLMDGRNLDTTWYRIMLSQYKGCWVPSSTGTPSGDISALRVLLDVPTYTPTPIIDCTTYLDEVSCNAQPLCAWTPGTITRGYCGKK